MERSISPRGDATMAELFEALGAADSSGITGINNAFDAEPPLVDENYGYQGGTGIPRGRQFTMEVSKRF